MAAGFLKIPYESKVVRYDDEKTPLQLTNRKMLPIWVNENGNAINESLDIIALIDTNNKLDTKKIVASPEWKSFQERIDQIGNAVHSLAMPYFIYTQEFDEKSRDYFRRKKEEKRGPFEVLVKNRNLFEKDLKRILVEVEKDIGEFYKSNQLSLFDIALASHLWGIYVVPEFQFSEKMHAYLQKVKRACRFDYHADFWK